MPKKHFAFLTVWKSLWAQRDVRANDKMQVQNGKTRVY